ncbi:hypothetical protein [Dyadobacter sp. MSC1_007]|jgi:hypothetical protein|uniref:hypothetical protein n=1 Tax=Dyadobacter sp. MSC1_007 TaxID=2909264 RepID=UPI00202FDA0F|nr:hypothetical protein [Dyadobacter sp. MSC1_007]
MTENNEQRKELEEKILSKRQQIDFEQKDLEETANLSPENRENPDVMEETKNYDDPADSVVEKDEMKSLQAAEKQLKTLLKELNNLNRK